MANYKVVDAEQLDNDLRSIADTIRAKNGTTEDINFPEGYIAAYESTPTIIENVEANLNFANGDQMESLPEGYAAKSVKIKKPENLTPENIAEGVEIAGIVGTHEGGCDHNIIEHIEIALDFSNGNMTETLPEGYSVHSATILKPDTLIAENIAEGVTIAGIVGTHKGGGGGAATDEPMIAYAYDDSGNIVAAKFYNFISIPAKMFYQNSTLASIDFSGSPNLTSIGDNAFYQCTALTNINWSNGLTHIGSKTFYGCKGLKNVIIPDSVTSIGSSAFSECKGLMIAIIGDGLINIPTYLFQHCISLRSVTVGRSVTSVGSNAFDNCPTLVEVVNHSSLTITIGGSDNGAIAKNAKEVHTGVSKINNVNGYMFYTAPDGTNYMLAYDGNETDLVLPNNYNGENYEIFQYAFYGRKELKSVIIPNSVTSIGAYAFYECEALTSVNIPDGVTNIQSNTFYYCKGLTSITIPDSVITIGYYAFYTCINLTSIEIPKNVTTITNNAFYGCSKMTSAIFVDTEGWSVKYSSYAAESLASTDLANASTAATYLRDTYRKYNWTKT